MSLINEALKRTRDSAYQSVQTPPPILTEYRMDDVPKSNGSKTAVLIAAIVAVFVLAGAVVLVSRPKTREHSVKDTSVPSTDATITDTRRPLPGVHPTPAAATTQPPVAETPPPAPTSDAKVSEDQIVAKVMERIKAEQPAASSPAAPPKLVLQGITYSKDGSDAMINGVTVHEGEDIEGARVVTIESRRVTLDFNGHEIILRLP